MSESRPAPRGSWPAAGAATLAAAAVLAIVFAGLCGRILAYPLNRDENLFITVSSLVGSGDLYTDLGYNHLPYLPWLLGGLYAVSGTGHYLLAGRLLLIAFWIAALAGLWLIARQLRLGFWPFFAAALLLMGNVLLLGTPGMVVTNNFAPLPAAFFAFLFLLRALGAAEPSSSPSPAHAVFAGIFVSLAIGLKANYIFLAPFFVLATVLAPTLRSPGERLRLQALPLAVGGLLGGLPVLAAMAREPDAFFAHTVRYFTQMQDAFWSRSTEPVVATLPQKVLLAEAIWTANSTMLAMAAILALPALAVASSGWRGGLSTTLPWPALTLACLAACGFLVAFVPSPSFPQYFVPPVPFLILMVLALRARIAGEDAVRADAVLVAFAGLAVLCSASRIAPGLLDLLRPQRAATVAIHRDMQALAREAGFTGGERVATLSPVLALEAGLAVPHEFAAGQFVYRVADFVPPEDRRWYTSTSPGRLGSFLAANPPAAILVSGEEPIEAPFAAFAMRNGYAAFSLPGRTGGPTLYRRPGRP